MKKGVLIFIVLCCSNLCAQNEGVNISRDGFMNIATDARAAGQGDMGVATAPDAFSQIWNPSKYLFSEEKFEIGITQIVGNSSEEFNEFNQANLNFYNQLDERSAYSFSLRGYSYSIETFEFVKSAVELSVDVAYTLRLDESFAMSVGARYILVDGKVPLLDDAIDVSSLYGIDVSGFFFGNELAYNKFNGRWRAGFNCSNLRGKSLNDNKVIEIYAPSTIRIGGGFDFIFSQDKSLGLTTEYETLLDSYVETSNGKLLDFGLEGSVLALGFEYIYKQQLMARTGYSHGINRRTDSFVALGIGFKGKFVDIDVASLLGVSIHENPIREKLRVSLSLNLEEVLFQE